jgi:hypothetical protein
MILRVSSLMGGLHAGQIVQMTARSGHFTSDRPEQFYLGKRVPV